MQTLLTHKTVSMTELREPAKVLSQAGDTPVAIMNRNQVVAYLVPVAAVEKLQFENTADSDMNEVLRMRRTAIQATLDYLQDK